MGYDVFGKRPSAPSGEYFRRNIWTWPALAGLCLTLAPDETRSCKRWYSNDGDGLNAANSVRLAERLQQLLDDGTVATYIKEHGKFGQREEERNATSIADLFETMSGSTILNRHHAGSTGHITEEDVAEFLAFLRTCGGFSIY